jgi:lipoprotein NlpD
MANISHQKARSLMLLASDESILPRERLALDAHLEICDECAAYVRTLETTRQNLRRSLHHRWDGARPRISIQKIQTGSRRTSMFKTFMVTAGTLAVIAVLAFVVFNMSGTLSSQKNTASRFTETSTRTVIPAPTDGITPTLQPTPTLASKPQAGPVFLGKNLLGAHWSPDGQHMLLKGSESNRSLSFFGVNRDGTGLVQLFDFESRFIRWTDDRNIVVCQSQFSPDGKIVKGKLFSGSAFAYNPHPTELSEEEKTSAQANNNCNPIAPSAHSPDGKMIAFAKNDDPGLYFMDSSGENVRHVIGADLSNVEIIKWEMDASGISSLTFSALDKANTGMHPGIYTAQVDLSGRMTNRRLIHLLPGEYFWLLPPDQQRMAYPVDSKIHVSNLDGSQESTLTGLPGSNIDPAWSPDGKLIAFSSDVNHDTDVFVANADGTNLRYYRIPEWFDQFLEWAPDSQSLFFWSEYYQGSGEQNLFLLDVKDMQPYIDAQASISGAGACQPVPQSTDLIYTVKDGDTLSALAATFGVSIQNIIVLNKLSANGAITIGQQLRIPLPTPTGSLTENAVTYIVQEGDSLVSIAVQYQVPVQEIIAANKLDQAGTVSIGQSLQIPLQTRKSIPAAVTTWRFDWPLPKHLIPASQDFSETHPSLDIAGAVGDPVWAASDGTVIFAGPADGGLGNTVIVDHGSRVESIYAHLAEVRVSCFEHVTHATILGTLGQPGNADNPFLYFEIRQDNSPRNPWMFLP